MFDFHEKRKIRTWLYSKVTIGLIGVLCVFMAVSVYQRYEVEREMAARRAATQAELEALNERRETLEAKVDHLENERGLEAEIRNRFDVAKEGEQVVIIVDSEVDEEPSAEVAPIAEPEPWYKLW